jgi:2-isopropylmalate synthase
MQKKKIFIYDSTLREGSQSAKISYSVEDKLLVAKKLDEIGVDYIEGGWPVRGVNEKEFEFFRKVKKLKLKRAKIAAFGSTRRVKNTVKNDPILNSLLEAETPVITIFGKSWDLHVLKVLNTTPEENLKLIRESVEYLKSKKKEVVYDAEHFFDGYKNNPQYAMACIKAAQEAGADCIALCDTNGGATVEEMNAVTLTIREEIECQLGVHLHNDSGLAIANSLIAVKNGYTQVQGTMNGFGERTGNADLTAVIPLLSIKMGYETIPDKCLKKLTEASHYLYEVANMTPDDRQPFVGKNAFAHKAGVHANAVLKIKESYEHMNPELVGNERQILISDQAGVSSLMHKAAELGFNLHKDDPKTREFMVKIKKLESEGYEFENADASLKLFLKKNLTQYKKFFDLAGLRVISEDRSGELFSEATIKIKVGAVLEHTAAEGAGPVNALDNALRKALVTFYPQVSEMRLVDYKVRVIEGNAGTGARVRVLIESADKSDVWTTVGVSENIIEASWLALVDSVEYKLMKGK